MSGNVVPSAPADETLRAEERARANVYALIAQLFFAAPDSNLFAQICADGEFADEGKASPLTQAWRALQNTCRGAYPAVIKQEYDALFVGVGKARVTLYTSHYVDKIAPDRHLVMLREQLETLDLALGAGTFEIEDHISGVCDVMRFLIEQQAPLAEQQRFFARFVGPRALAICDAVTAADLAEFYRQVAAFARAFFEIEAMAFEIEESPQNL